MGQRVTGVALVLLGLWFIGMLVAGMPVQDYEGLVGFIRRPLNAVLLSLLCLVASYHSSLGVEVVIEDYVHDHRLNTASILMARIAHALIAVICVLAVVRIGLGA